MHFKCSNLAEITIEAQAKSTTRDLQSWIGVVGYIQSLMSKNISLKQNMCLADDNAKSLL